ncbi:MAG: DNA polymerase I [Saprospiraceae bacterium]|nr:DNA polymerase I [Saprospiraceae bacterium]
MKKLFLLDGHALVYRAHYAFMTRPLLNSKGWNVSCISGFTRVLLDVMKREKPTHLAVSFDLPTPTFRHEMFEKYKANRDKQPEDISFGLPFVMRILRGMNIPILVADGYEADDVIGTLSKKAEKEGFKVYMMTPDKDYGQLVSDNIFMYKPAKNGNEAEVWGVKEVCENWGIERVEQVVDILGMQGDAVDNIPGLPGIGPKTAATLLAKYGSLEEVIAHADELKGKQQDIVKNFAEQGLLSKKLAAIDLEVPIEFDAVACEIGGYDNEMLSEVFKELEFKTIATEIIGKANDGSENIKDKAVIHAAASKIGIQGDLFGAITGIAEGETPSFGSGLANHSVAEFTIHNTPHDYILANTAEKRADLIEKLKTQSLISFDTETTGIDANSAELVGLSFSWKAHEAYYVPVPADQKAAQAIVEEFRGIFENKEIRKVGQNIKYDLIMMKWYGVDVLGVYFDTMIAHYLIEPELRHNMNYMAATLLKYEPVSIETLIGKGKNQLSMRDIRVERVAEYAAEDADITFQLYETLLKSVDTEGVGKLMQEIEMPLVEVLTELEYNGIRVDGDYLNTYSVELEEKIRILEEDIYAQAGNRFNIGSPKQVGDMLFDSLKIPYRWKKTGKSDQYRTDEEAMSELATAYPICQTILDYRGLAKLKSTYVDALPKMLNPRTKRIHSSFNQALAATGRLSSNNPNLQNIPIRTEEGRKVRNAFIPRDENHVLLSADYSQIELRLIAEIANETAMLEAFQQGIDIHLATAAKVYGVTTEEVTSDQRRAAKTVNFSILYGAGAQNLSQQLGIPRTEAKQIIEAYFTQYKDLKKYMETVVEDARKVGYVTTLMGRKRYLRDIDSRNQLARSNAERVAVNTPIQGSAADLIKMAMILIHQELKAQNLQTKMVLQVHDELVFDVPKNELDIVRPMIEHCMKTAIPNLKVPIEVGVGVGNTWLEAH